MQFGYMFADAGMIEAMASMFKNLRRFNLEDDCQPAAQAM